MPVNANYSNGSSPSRYGAASIINRYLRSWFRTGHGYIAKQREVQCAVPPRYHYFRFVSVDVNNRFHIKTKKRTFFKDHMKLFITGVSAPDFFILFEQQKIAFVFLNFISSAS